MPLTSIFAIGPEGIWSSAYAGSYVYWNGQEWVSEWIPEMNSVINAIWSASSSDVYFVSDNGSIVYYDGSTITRMESGTDIRLTSITGSVDMETGQVRSWAAGRDDPPLRGQLLFLNDTQWESVWDNDHPSII
ncbi:MAG: hypothetical protein ACE5D1_05285 [Fidelibacterota bacterium]